MSKGIIACQFLGRFGNCCFQYAAARSYAERNDLTLQTDSWIGQRVFGLNDPPINNPDSLKRVDENTIQEGMTNILYRSYSQQQKCLTYTRKDCLRWFKFTPWVEDALHHLEIYTAACHVRRGDFEGYKYPMPSKQSYKRLIWTLWPHLGTSDVVMVSDESPTGVKGFGGTEFEDIPDFYQMCKAPILLRANSTFSWWAGTLNHGAVYSPIMDGLEGGKEHDVEFVRGNWPKFRSDLPFLTDLHLKE